MLRTTPLIAVGAVAASASFASAQTVKVIYSEIAGDPTSMVPAGAGVPAGTLFDGFDRPYRSPDGLRWIITATSNLATTEDELIIVGGGMVGATVVREGTAFGSPTAGENTGLIDRNCGIADTGEYAFATNTDGPTTSDEYIVRYDGALWQIVAQEGSALPGMATEAFGTSLDSACMLNDGMTVAFRAPSTVGALGSDFDDFLYQGAAVQAQEGTTVPSDQAGGGVEVWDNFDLQDYYVSADGTVAAAQGDLSGATTTDDIVAVNNRVVIQEGSLLTGTSFTSAVAAIVEMTMDSDGSWYARGDNADDQDWVVRSGDVVATSSAPITNGASETFSDALFSATFFWMSGNNNGDYVVGGTTSNADAETDAVLVLNGTTVILRQGDPVDLDGNGLYDDDVFVDIFNNDDGFLTDAGLLYFTADLYDSALVSLGQALLVYDITGLDPCEADIAPVPSDGEVGFSDLLAVLSNWGPCPAPCETSCTGDIDGNCMVDFDDLLAVLSAWGPC